MNHKSNGAESVDKYLKSQMFPDFFEPLHIYKRLQRTVAVALHSLML